MTLPIDRTALTAAQTNQVPNALIRSALNIAALTTPYNTIDELYNYTSGLVAGGVLQPYPAFLSRQALINGNFDVWQRGTSFTNPVGNIFVIDRWKVGLNPLSGVIPTSVIHSKQILTSGDIASSFYFYRVNVNSAGTGSYRYLVQQNIESGTRYLCGSGKEVTVSFYAKSSIVGKRMGVSMTQSYGTGGSSSEVLNGSTFSLTSSWVKYSFTFTTNTLVGKTFGTSNDDYLGLTLGLAWDSVSQTNYAASSVESFVGSGNIDIAQVQVNTGDQSLPFQPRSFADEMALCQRYYEKSYDYTTVPGSVFAGTEGFDSQYVETPALSGGRIRSHLYFKVRKRITPTMLYWDLGGNASKVTTVSSDTQANNITPSVTPLTPSEYGCQFTSTQGPMRIGWAADAEL